MLVDARNLMAASFHGTWGFKEEDLELFDDLDFRALMSFMRTITTYVREWSPTEVVLVSDRRCFARYEILPSYKGKRRKTKSYETHKTECLELARLILPVRWVVRDGYEADDLMARMAERYCSEHKVIAITSDRDFVQVIQALKNVSMYDHVKKTFLNGEDFPNPMCQYKSITGDTSDNIPSVTGDKTARKIMSGEIDLNGYLDGGTTRTEKRPRREVYERNRRMVSLLGEHALLPAPASFGFEPGSSLRFNGLKARSSLRQIFPDEGSSIERIVGDWETWCVTRAGVKRQTNVVDMKAFRRGIANKERDARRGADHGKP